MGPGQDYDRRTEAHDAAGVRGSPNSELMLTAIMSARYRTVSSWLLQSHEIDKKFELEVTS